ncbi:MAG: hypothetical protein ACC742_10340 [Thermoanaerobaculales bacterium]
MMNARWLLPCGVLMVMALPGVAVAQQEEEQSPPAILDSEELDVSGIEQILRGEQEVLQGDLFSYDPAGRRDPFRSLLEGFEEPEPGSAKVRPPGLPGMLVEELKVEGIIETPTGILAFVQGRDNVSYIIRPGTKLYNGEVKEILPTKVVFRQQVNDPKRIKPYEEVVRVIKD